MIKYFSLPGYWNHFFDVQAVIEYRKKHPEYFYSDRIVDSAYGLPPNLIWHGGRVILGNEPKLTHDYVFNYFRSLDNFHLRHVCTNILLDENMVNDPDCNKFIDKYYQSQDYIIINNKLLQDHLRPIVSEDHFIYSTSLNIKDIDNVNKYSENNLFVLDYMKNNDNEYLKQLKYPQNIELICAELCVDNCAHRHDHYVSMSKVNAHLPLEPDEATVCIHRRKRNFETSYDLNYYLTHFSHEIDTNRIDELADMGIQHFKISGRERPSVSFFIFVTYYLVLPEYQDKVRKELSVEAEKLKTKYKIFGQSK